MAYTPTVWVDYPNTTTPITAAALNNIEGWITAADAAWTAYTPTWEGTGGTPAIGNGELSGRYKQVGKTVYFRIYMLWGSTTTANTATAWTLTLPVTAYELRNTPFAAYVRDAGTLTYRAIADITTSTKLIIWAADSNVQVGYLSPHTWANSDVLSISGTYEAA